MNSDIVDKRFEESYQLRTYELHNYERLDYREICKKIKEFENFINKCKFISFEKEQKIIENIKKRLIVVKDSKSPYKVATAVIKNNMPKKRNLSYNNVIESCEESFYKESTTLNIGCLGNPPERK